METNQIFKQIYKDLKEEIMKNSNEIFVKEYTIPSINYSKNEDINELYFISGIEMELDKMMDCFENKIYFSKYKDKYFFSNNKEITQEKLMKTIENEILREQIEGRIKNRQTPYLKEKLYEKVENEYKSFIEELKKMNPEEIIEKAYELVTKEQIIEQIKEISLDKNEIKALMKQDDLLSICYEDWLHSDGKLGENLFDTIVDTIDIITTEYGKEQKESR